MKTSHTSGPWWTSNLEVGDVPLMNVKVARVSGSSYEEAKANARLIAAAPELLDALRDMVSDHADLSAGTLDFARRAIAKATGAA